MAGQIWSLIRVWLEKIRSSVLFLKTILFLDWIPISEEKKIKSQEPVPGSAGEDHRVALLRRWYVCLGIGVDVRGVGIILELREWILVDCITYY
jgi:hypothetical protein